MPVLLTLSPAADGPRFRPSQHLAEWWFALQALDLLAAGRGKPDSVS
jgi:hypothetical protein